MYMPTNGVRSPIGAARSVLDQNYHNLELIIVDDSKSQDQHPELQNFANEDKRIRVLKNSRKPGASGARNTAIIAAKGQFITGIDDDDLMLQGRIKCMREAWNDQYALVFCGHIRRLAEVDQVVPIPNRLVSPELIAHRNIIGNQIFTKTDYLREVGLFDEDLPAYQDFDLWVRLMRERGYAKGINHNNYIFVQTGDNRISSDRRRRKIAWLKFMSKHKPTLSTRQRQSLSLLAYKEQWKQPSWRRLLSLSNCTNWRLGALLVRRRFLGR